MKQILFVLLIAGMALPGLQKAFLLFKVKPLNGDFVFAEQPALSAAGWMDGTFQTKFDSYMEQHIGFRPFLVRLNNQIAFSFYDKVTNKNIVKGKDDFLFEKWFINTYYGKDFIGTEKIGQQVSKLTVIDSVLKSRGVQLIIALAPGKADIYPEKIPGFMIGDVNSESNYKVYSQKLRESPVTVFDINSWFKKLKPEFDRNLFAKGGTHWSRDGALMALDSLLKLIEHETGEPRNKLQIDGITQTQTPRDPDVDILKVSNLLFENLHTEYYYPDFHYEKTHPTKGKLIANGDSFFWIIFESGLKSSFTDVKYWYYFKTIFPDNFKEPTTIGDISLLNELLASDVVLLLCSTSNLKKLGWGFIDRAYDLLTKDIEKEIAVEKIIRSIKNDPKWFASVKAKAERRNIEPDSMLRLDAEYVYKRK
ncbi:MAG: hypothetical protein L3J66_00370 [Bacteroidales bacterium]|nr:hypothetical protein [Bacteroidales bacterium]